MKLTKSLHTVTATVNVARMLLRLEPAAQDRDLSPLQRAALLPPPRHIARAALDVLGYDIDDFSADDPTLAAIIKQIGKL